MKLMYNQQCNLVSLWTVAGRQLVIGTSTANNMQKMYHSTSAMQCNAAVDDGGAAAHERYFNGIALRLRWCGAGAVRPQGHRPDLLAQQVGGRCAFG